MTRLLLSRHEVCVCSVRLFFKLEYANSLLKGKLHIGKLSFATTQKMLHKNYSCEGRCRHAISLGTCFSPLCNPSYSSSLFTILIFFFLSSLSAKRQSGCIYKNTFLLFSSLNQRKNTTEEYILSHRRGREWAHRQRVSRSSLSSRHAAARPEATLRLSNQEAANTSDKTPSQELSQGHRHCYARLCIIEHSGLAGRRWSFSK